jgi:hypothetical protein
MTRVPSHDALTALPGDRITFWNDCNEQDSAYVKTGFWAEAWKGGRVWSYELHNGEIVPNDKVVAVEKMSPLHCEQEALANDLWNEVYGKRNDYCGTSVALGIIDDSDLPSVLKTAIGLLVEGDLKSLEAAKFLVETRISMLSKSNNQRDVSPANKEK